IMLLLCSIRAMRSTGVGAENSSHNRRNAMKPLQFALTLAATLAIPFAVAPACAQGGKSGVERLYILNCGEGVAGDISRWSPGGGVGGWPGGGRGGRWVDSVDGAYLTRPGQGWLWGEPGVPDATAARPGGRRPADPRMTHWRRPKTLAAQLDQLGVKPSDIKY